MTKPLYLLGATVVGYVIGFQLAKPADPVEMSFTHYDGSVSVLHCSDDSHGVHTCPFSQLVLSHTHPDEL